MKIFGDFEVVKFPEENLILVTRDSFLYYIYDLKYKCWKKHCNAGNDRITVSNYQDISRKELEEAMQGMFPESETDFMRRCNPSQLCIRDMLSIFKEDYANCMSDSAIYHAVHEFLLESDMYQKTLKSFEEVKKVLDNAVALRCSSEQVLQNINELSLTIIGRDIFKKEIGIVDGHDYSSYFWIMPVKIIDYSDTDNMDNVVEMRSMEISIEEDDVAQYLTPSLYKYFDDKLEANMKRKDASGFEWYLTYNFFTFCSITNILKDMKDTIDAFASERENEYTARLKEKRGRATCRILYAKNQSEEQIKEYNANRPQEDTADNELIIDFYQRFIYRMEYMMKVGKEKGYDLISFMGP